MPSEKALPEPLRQMVSPQPTAERLRGVGEPLPFRWRPEPSAPARARLASRSGRRGFSLDGQMAGLAVGRHRPRGASIFSTNFSLIPVIAPLSPDYSGRSREKVGASADLQ